MAKGQFIFRLEPELKEKLKQIANDRETTPSQVVRRVVKRFLKSAKIAATK